MIYIVTPAFFNVVAYKYTPKGILKCSESIISTPFFYTNSTPHIGHLYTCVVSDFLHKFNRLNGTSSKLITGTDEHGKKVSDSAVGDTMSFVDKISSGFKHMCDRYAMDYDVFFRTSNTQHKQNVINIWNTLVEKGIIYKGIYHKRINDNQDYYGNEYLNDDNHSISNDQFTKPIETYYFKLSNFQEKLEKLVWIYIDFTSITKIL